MWQIFIIIYLIFGTVTHLSRKVLAQKLGDHNLLVHSIYALFFLLPTGIILSFFFPHNLNVGLVNLLLLLGGSIIWPIYNLAAFQSNRKVDVGIFVVINNLSPLFTLLVAFPFLHEKLNTGQFIGVFLLIFSGTLAVFSQLHKHNRASLNGILMCLLTAAIVGVAIAYERFLLNRVDFGAYIIYGWGSQIAWAVILANKELRKLPKILNSDLETRLTIIKWGTTGALRSVAFILALKISGNASIISAATDFMSVSVVIAAYFFLGEREHIIYKWLAAGIGVSGLLLITK